jgi:hypothetical protein
MPLLLPLLWAYIDPVSGSILLQIVSAGIIGGIAYCIRPLWRLGRRLLGRPAKPSEPEIPPGPDGGAPQ